MITKHYRYRFTDLNISAEEVAFPMGYNEGAVPPEIIDMITIEMDKFNEVEEICGVVVEFDLKVEEDLIYLADQSFDAGRIVTHFLKKSERIAVFQCTAGKYISEMGKTLMDNGDVVEGFIVDIIGSVAVEKAMDIIHKSLEDTMREQGLSVTNRYSPGYCGWNIEEQFKLFSLFEEDYCGITLKPSALMLPVKSVSGFIGIGQNVQFKPYTCDHCTQQTCIYSKRKREKV